MNRLNVHLISWLLLVSTLLLSSCNRDPNNPSNPEPQKPKGIDSLRNPSVVAQEEVLLKLIGEGDGIAFASRMRVGDTVSIGIWSHGEMQIDGMKPSGHPSRHPDIKEWVCYTITAPSIVVKGDVRGIKMFRTPVTAIVTAKSPNLEICELVQCPSISEIDFSKNENLQWIETCDLENLSWIALPNSISLNSVDLSNNPRIEQVDFSGCKMIEAINLTNTSIKVLDLMNNGELKIVELNNTPCDVPKLKHLKHLEELWLEHKGLTSLDVTNLPESLVSLFVHYNNLSGTLDLSHLNNLEELYCNKNQLTSLKLHHIPTHLWAEDNQLRQIGALTNENQNYTKYCEKLESLPTISLYNNRLSSETITQFVSKLFVIDSSKKPSWGMAIIASRQDIVEKYSFGQNAFTRRHLDEMRRKGWNPWGITTSETGGGGLDPIN